MWRLLLFLFFVSPASAQNAGNLYLALLNSTTIENDCPSLVGAQIGVQNDRSTWLGQFASTPSSQCLSDVASIANALQPIPTYVILTSASTPLLNGNYAIDSATQSNIQAISIYITVNGRFPNSQSTQAWPDTSGVIHRFTSTTQWLTFATKMADFISALDLGQSPANTITIP